MNLDIDSAKLLYALGVLFAIGAFLYFVRDLVFGLSITVKAALLFVGFATFFVAGVAVDRGLLDVVAFALSGISYTVFLAYVILRFELGDVGSFLLFGLSAALFVGLGYLVRERSPSLERRTAGFVVGGLVVVSLLLVGADVATAGVQYEVELEDSVTVEPPSDAEGDREAVLREVRVGTMTASNGVGFRRPLDLPDFRACLVGAEDLPRAMPEPGSGIPVSYERRGFDRRSTIGGGEELTYDLVARLPVSGNATGPIDVDVERGTTCDVTRDSPTVIVIVGEG